MTKRTAKVMLFLLSKKLFLVFVKKYFNSKLLDSIMLVFVSLKRCFKKMYFESGIITYRYIE